MAVRYGHAPKAVGMALDIRYLYLSVIFRGYLIGRVLLLRRTAEAENLCNNSALVGRG